MPLTDHLAVVDSAGMDQTLHVFVRDKRDGRTCRVRFDRSLHGEYKVAGGGGLHHAREDVFEAAKDVAAEYVREELNHPVVSREEWQHVKDGTAARILMDSDEYHVSRIDGEDGGGE